MLHLYKSLYKTILVDTNYNAAVIKYSLMYFMFIHTQKNVFPNVLETFLLEDKRDPIS